MKQTNYGNAGNRLSKTNYLNNVTENYTYDPIYQLTQVTQGVTTTESYSYDAVGNRLSSLGMSPYAYNSSNQLTSTPAATFAYDANGNTATKVDASGTTTYTWDFENRLTQAVVSSVGTTTLRYDPFGRRIQKSGPNGTLNYLYDGANAIEEMDATGNLLAHYAQGAAKDEPLAELRSGTSVYYQQDGLSSVTSLGSATGTISTSYTYDAFGNTAVSSGSFVNPYLYTGRDYDAETGLRYYRARYYDPSVGRFISEDPLKGFSGTLNFYMYVKNRPTNLIDPRGLCADAPDPRLRLVVYSDCSYPGEREIVYQLQGPFGSDPTGWYVTEHQNPPSWAPAVPSLNSPEGTSTGSGGEFDDTIFGTSIGNSIQTFTISRQDPRKFRNTPQYPVIVQLNGQDYGSLGIWHGGSQGYMYVQGLKGNGTEGWAPCIVRPPGYTSESR